VEADRARRVAWRHLGPDAGTLKAGTEMREQVREGNKAGSLEEKCAAGGLLHEPLSLCFDVWPCAACGLYL